MMKNVVSLYRPEMPFTAVARTAFDDALGRLARVRPKTSTIPILSCIKIVSAKGNMTMTATDLDILMSISMPVSADSSDMTAVVMESDLRKFLALADGDFIRITSSDDGERATIYCGASEMVMPVLPVADWPSEVLTFDRKGATWFDVSPSTLRIAVDATLPAVSYEATRTYLQGAFVQLYEDGIRFVSTDGHRLHMRDIVAEKRSKFEGGVTMTASLMNVLRYVVEQRSYGEYLRVSLSADKLVWRLSLGDMIITAKVGDGIFPDYQRVMPAEVPNKITVSGAALLQFIAGAGGRPIKISAFPDSVLLETREDDVTRRKEVEATLDGEPVQFGISATYLKQAIGEAAPAGGMVTFEINHGDGPMIISGTEKGFLAVLMPMRV